MQSLNENLIRQKAKVDDIRHVRNLNVWGMDLVDIQILKRLPNLEVCSLSVNKIESLDVFEACPRLTELYLRKNLVADLSELYHLSHCPMLKSLWLSENPVARHPGYRLFAIKLLRNLQKLDDSDVSEGERRQAEKLSEREIFAGQLGGAGQPPPQQQQAAAPPPQQQQPSHASPPHHHPNREVHERPAHRPQPQHRHSPPDALPNAYNGDDVPVGAAVGGAAPAAAPALPAKERAVRAERDKQREVEERRAAAAHHEREREREREHHHAAARTPPQRHHQPPGQQQPHQQQQHPAQHRHREEQHDRDRQARHRHGAGQSPPPQYREREQYDRAPQQQRQEQRGGGYSHDRHDVHDRHHHPQQQHHHQAPPPPHHHHGDGHGHGHGHGPPRRHPSPDEAAMNDAQLAMVQSILSFLPHLGHRQLEMISLELQNLQQAQRRQASHS